MLTKDNKDIREDKKIKSLHVIIRFHDDRICEVLSKFCRNCACITVYTARPSQYHHL